MHDFFSVKVSDSLADISEILFDLGFAQRTGFDFLEQGPIIGVLQNHVCYFALFIDLVVEKLDDFGVEKLVVKDDFVLCQFVNLFKKEMVQF